MQTAVIVLSILLGLVIVGALMRNYQRESYWRSRVSILQDRFDKNDALRKKAVREYIEANDEALSLAVGADKLQRVVELLQKELTDSYRAQGMLGDELQKTLEAVKPFITRYGEGFAMGNRNTVDTMDKLRQKFPNSIALQAIALEGFAGMQGDTETPIFEATKRPLIMRASTTSPHKG